MVKLPVPEPVLNSILVKTYGGRCYPVSGKPLTDGTRKTTWLFNLKGAGPRQVVLLVWHNEHDYFNEQSDPANPANDLNAPNLYRLNTELLLSHGLTVPGIYAFDDSRSEVPYAFALVEYKEVQSFNEYSHEKPEREIHKVLARMREFLEQMHTITRSYPGVLPLQEPSPDNYLDRVMSTTLTDLDVLARVHSALAGCAGAVRERLTDLRTRIEPREQYVFIHGELGPDEHFLINRQGQIVILDVDGCQFGDLEREHAYLKLRFPVYEQAFARPDLDPLRMEFYGLCLHLMAAFGHYQLMIKGFPGKDTLKSIYEWNAEQVVRMMSEAEAGSSA